MFPIYFRWILLHPNEGFTIGHYNLNQVDFQQKSYKKLLFFRSKPPFERDKPTAVPIKSPAQKMKKTHRRIQSDGSIRSLPPSIQIPDDTHSNKSIGEGKGSPVSQDYDIISDSELPSSCDGHEDYLVVDGFIDQTVESFTPLQVFVRYFYYLLINYYPKKGRIRRFRKTWFQKIFG